MLTACLLLLSLTGCKEHWTGLLNPKGVIAYEERKLFFDTLALMLIVVLPVIVMSFTFVYHYQISPHIRDYKPHWGHSYFLESLWWGIPCAIIVVLAILTWKKTHELDPYHRIAGHDQPPMLIQVIALPWKWLFIYPEQNIATINYLALPVGQQVEYWMTTDNVPMSAFFVPQLGSQIYAMAGMRTRLHLLANQVGNYEGLNTQFNGDGFSDMHFTVQVMELQQLQQWVTQVKKSSTHLTDTTYHQLLNPSIGDKPQFFSGVEKDLFNNVITTYMNTFGNNHPRTADMRNSNA
ncbi:MAG: ubiquinol oxidase subunit II [Gammaproteobacteria bacterium]|nr:MAG: ubiquinol oxidase subunit II [Gammaproteobacteria bacterium]